MLNQFQIKGLQAGLSTILRGGRGNMGTAYPQQPKKALVFYENEASPQCRRVREVMTKLNLDYHSRPCPRRGLVFTKQLKKHTGSKTVPVLYDKNTGKDISGAQPIIDYLFAHYSETGHTPNRYRSGHPKRSSYANHAATLVSLGRGGLAQHPRKNRRRGQPDQPLHLYGFETSPFCRLVRERLSQLELEYINHNVARERLKDIGGFGHHMGLGKYKPQKGGKRDHILREDMQGKMQVPFLVDPNTDTQLYESKDILAYLDKHYG